MAHLDRQKLLDHLAKMASAHDGASGKPQRAIAYRVVIEQINAGDFDVKESA